MPSKIRILLVDDDEHERELFAKMLKRFGHKKRWELYHASNGQEALAFLRKDAPYEEAPRIQLVFCDYMMPVLTGSEFLTSLRSEEWYQGLPVVVMLSSSSYKNEIASELYKAGAVSFVEKPNTFEDFETMMRYWLFVARLE